MVLKRRLWALFILIVFVGCAGYRFPYKYYALDADHYDGHLRGPKPIDDLPLASCEPTAANKAPCITIYTDEFLRLKTDLTDTKNQLQKCQAGQ